MNLNIGNMFGLHQHHNALISIALAPVPQSEVGRFGVVYREGDILDEHQEHQYNGGKYSRILRFEEKNPNARSNLNNASLYIVDERLLHLIERDVEVAENRNSGVYHNDWTDPATGKHYRLGVFSNILNGLGKINEGEVNPNFSDWAHHIFQDILTHHHEIYAPNNEKDARGFFGFYYNGLWADDGTRSAILEANLDLLREKGGFGKAYDFDWWPVPYKNRATDAEGNIIKFGRKTNIETGAEIIGPAIIGDNVTIRSGARVRNSVIGTGWCLEKGLTLDSTVLLPDRSTLGLKPFQKGLVYRLPGAFGFEHSIIASGFMERGRTISPFDAGGYYSAVDEVSSELLDTGNVRFLRTNNAVVVNPDGEVVRTRL
ncbi:MAG: NDP-sugar synthase, partial [Candidatus Margulisiibacteriota bacterium]